MKDLEKIEQELDKLYDIQVMIQEDYKSGKISEYEAKELTKINVGKIFELQKVKRRL